jgi:hypothetical protein
MKCYGCQSTEHLLKDCPVTSPAQKQILHEEMKRQYKYSNRQYSKDAIQTTTTSSANASIREPSQSTIEELRPSSANLATRQSTEPKLVLRPRNAYANSVLARVPRPTTHIPIVRYEDDVYLNLGASDHMTGNMTNLTGIRDTLTNVILPDGSVVCATAMGTLRVSVVDDNTGDRIVIPLLNTLYVPGLTKTLWSVTQFAAEGHLVIVGTDDVTIMLNHGRAEEFHIITPHPFYHISRTPLPFAMAAIAQPCYAFSATASSGQIDSSEDEDSSQSHEDNDNQILPLTQKPPIGPHQKITLDILHRRLGHQSTQSLLTANEWNMWNGVKVRIKPDQFCFGCGIGAIRKSPSSN